VDGCAVHAVMVGGSVIALGSGAAAYGVLFYYEFLVAEFTRFPHENGIL
jgi:hypothetical protein